MPGPAANMHTKRSHWWIVFVLGLITISFGAVGYYQVLAGAAGAQPPNIWTFVDASYKAIQLLAMHAAESNTARNPWVEAARWIGALTFLATAWFLVVNRLRQEVRILRVGFWREHYVICGLTVRAMALIESMKAKDGKARIVVIDPEPEGELAQRCEALDICVIKGDVTEPEQLQTARVAQASEIVAVAQDDEVNIRVVAEVRALRRGAGAVRVNGTAEAISRAFCRAHIANSHLPEALQRWTESPLAGGKEILGSEAQTTLRFFDVFDTEARRVLTCEWSPQAERREEGSAQMAPLDGPGVGANEARRVHVVVLGMGRMGSALVVRAAKMGQFANGKPLRITVVDRDAQRQQEELYFRYPILATPNEVCDLQFRQLHADSLETRHLIEKCASEKETVLHVFVCLDSNARAVEIALRLWEIVAAHPHSYVHVRITSRASVGPILQKGGSGGGGARIQVFGMLEDTCTVETVIAERIEGLARGIHKEFVAARKAEVQAGVQGVKEAGRQGDPALVEWDYLREDFRESNRQQADHMGIKMRAIGCRIVPVAAPGETVTAFSVQEVEMLAELEHRRWHAERLLSGWRYGDATDKEQRLHSDLVAWEKLSEKVREYDRETVRKLPRWLAEVEPTLKVVRG